MKTAVEKIDPTRVKLSVEVPYAELKPSIDEAYKTIAKQVQVPGFRKGKVPNRIIDQRVGRPAVLQEAVNESLDDFYRKAIAEQELKPLGTPEVEIAEIPGLDGTEEGEFTFSVEVDVRPEFELPAFDTLKVEVEATEITDEDVTAELDALRGRFGTLTPADRPAAKDDFVTLDLLAEVDGEEVDSAQGISYQVGAGTMLDGMDEALDGLSAGEETTFTTKLAGGEHAGEEATVKIAVEAVKVRELPEADDEFAQLASEFDTIEELLADLREQAAKQKVFSQGVEARDKVLDALIEAVDLPVPASLVTLEVENHLEQENRLEDDVHRAEVTEQTEKQLRTQFVLDKIVEERGIQVQQPELIEYLLSAAQQYGMNPSEFAQALDSNGQVPGMIGEVGRRKALAEALGEAIVVDTKGNAVDLTEFVTPAGEVAEDDELDEDEQIDDDEEADIVELDDAAVEDTTGEDDK